MKCNVYVDIFFPPKSHELYLALNESGTYCIYVVNYKFPRVDGHDRTNPSDKTLSITRVSAKKRDDAESP